MTRDYFLRLYDHAVWANRRVLNLLNKLSPDNAPARRLFNHILAAEQLWMARLYGEDSSSIAIWPDFSADESAAVMEESHARYKQFLNTLEPESFSQTITYKHQTGRVFQTAIGDILTHVAQHGTGHRGQIVTLIRNVGAEPVNTDFITFVREIA
jgi:uncharacterized damage-inducible protein DinB